MRPVGEVRQALLDAATALATPERAPTLIELAAHSRVGLAAASTTLKNMVRTGALQIPRTRRVSYRNRPVAEYSPPDLVAELRGQREPLYPVFQSWSRSAA
jgi:hypothetical protein